MTNMSRINLVDLETFFCVGITAEERSRPQRLLISVSLEFDFRSAARSDRIEETINYRALAERLLRYGEGRSWNLVEKLATDLADLILTEFQPAMVNVEVKKFPLSQARYVSVQVTRQREQP